MVTAGRVVGEAEDGSGTDEFPDPVDVLRPSSDVAVYAPALTREFQTLGGEAIDEAAARLTALYLDAMGRLVQEAATYRDGRSSRKTTDIQKWGRRFYQGRVAKPPQFRVGLKSPAELTSHERIRQTEVLDRPNPRPGSAGSSRGWGSDECARWSGRPRGAT